MAKVFDYKIICVIGMFMLLATSCISESDLDNQKLAMINLSLDTGLAKKATRANGTIPSDNGSNIGENEGSINTVCVELFDESGNTITVHEYTYMKGQPEKIQTTTRATKMIVVANIKKGTFAGTTTMEDFLGKEQQLSYTTSTDSQNNAKETEAGSQTMTALPMTSGIVSPLNLSENGANNKTLELTRIVARVSISSITTSFNSNGPFAGATFTPTEIFMYNVNDQYAWNGTTSSSTKTVSGESSAPVSFAYLGTGTANYKAPSSISPQFFYVFPHSSQNPTKLVIKGTFTKAGGTNETVYYPIVINHAQIGTTFIDTNGNTISNTNDATIEANRAYYITATINGPGVTTPSENIDPSSLTINSQIQDWTNAAMTIDMNNSPEIGDYYFSDGSWGTLEDRATATVYPIGVVFSNTTTANDKAHGWTHGYAMALTNASEDSSIPVTMWSQANSNGDYLDEAGDTYSDVYVNFRYQNYTEYTSYVTNKDGYSETQAIKNSGQLGYSKENYPAFYNALNYALFNAAYTPPLASSDWFLPSVGQWWDIIVNLGGMSSNPTITSLLSCKWYDQSGVNNYSLICVNNINDYLTAINTYSTNHSYTYNMPDLFTNINDDSSNGYYWTSSEYNHNASYYIYFWRDRITLYHASKNAPCKIRPCIAF